MIRTAITGKGARFIDLVLRIAHPKLVLGTVMFRTVGQDISGAAQHDPGEASPVLVPPVHRDGNDWVLLDVADSLERDVGALGLLVNGDVEGPTVKAKANRHEVRRTVAALLSRGGQRVRGRGNAVAYRSASRHSLVQRVAVLARRGGPTHVLTRRNRKQGRWPVEQ